MRCLFYFLFLFLSCDNADSVNEFKNDPPISSFTEPDSDCDGVVDSMDKCPGGDDRYDYNNNGVPDCIDPPPYNQVQAAWKCGTPSLQKVFVCTKTPSGGYMKVCTYYSAVGTHISKGGYLGPCMSCL